MTWLFWKYYSDLTKFNLAISILTALVAGPFGGILLFPTGGMILSLMAYSFVHGTEYYLYYNMGITKTRLILTSWIVNIGVSVLLGAMLAA